MKTNSFVSADYHYKKLTNTGQVIKQNIRFRHTNVVIVKQQDADGKARYT